MTTAFLTSDQIVGDIDSAVTAAAELDPRSSLRAEWTAIREHHASVTAEYLRLASPGSDHRPHPAEVQAGTNGLLQVNDEMMRFGAAHESELSRARGALHEASTLNHDAQVAITRAVTELEQADPSLTRLTTVIGAVDELSAADAAFQRASGLMGRRQAARAVIAAAARVSGVLSEAVGYAGRAQVVIRSVETLRNAISTRREQVQPTLSALRRDFSVECSTDLDGNQAIIDDALRRADDALATARSRLAAPPAHAAAAGERAREQLARADDAVDAVLDRLRLLRGVRDDPAAVERRVRFRLRDAQQFALNHSLVDEWGSVLDAQADRIARATSALDRIHPDYWAYVTNLEAVDQRIGEIVDRMRGQIATP
ncbi:hypothetical protein [Gordonia sp. CPCC 205515]|uniref:hypothetical protein n=1 Tax=Gordonia sp. CPCC 205515 TaxID=3140791 RepID=UPI003AF35594